MENRILLILIDELLKENPNDADLGKRIRALSESELYKKVLNG